jgi:hypothetical protein
MFELIWLNLLQVKIEKGGVSVHVHRSEVLASPPIRTNPALQSCSEKMFGGSSCIDTALCMFT